MTCVSVAALATVPAYGQAQADGTVPDDKAQSTVRDDTALQTIVVTGARPGIANIKPTDTVSGLKQTLAEIPRSVTTLDSSLLKDVQVRSIHDLTAVAPGTFTAAYFGVAGAIQIRGNVADSYYRGFKGINNLGYYETPTESVSGMEIVRGPVTPAYGAGKIGGMLNLTPKTDVAATLKKGTEPKALATAQVGSYGEFKATLEGGIPFQIGGNAAAVYAYGYLNESDSYFRHFSPNDKEIQLGFSMDMGDKWEFNAGARYLNQKGHLASPGWNRLTQQLIDNGTYLAGSPLVNLAPAGAQTLFPAQLAPVIGSLRQGVNFTTGNLGVVNDLTRLDPATVREVQLSRRNLNTSALDFNNNEVVTAYFDFIRTSDNGDQLKLQGFYENLTNDMFSAAGSSTAARGEVAEARMSYYFQRDFTDWLSTQTIAGVSYRHYKVYDYQNFGRQYVIWDRADLSAEPTADMIINNQYLNPNGNVWDFAYYSKIKNLGAFFNTDIALMKNFHVIGGLRWDNYNLQSRNDGLSSFGGALRTDYYGETSPFSYTISANYQTPWGIVPYFTYAKTRALETNKGGGVDPALIIGRRYLSPSKLTEVGIKGSMLGGKLFFGIAGYKQDRIQRDALSGALNKANSKGIEAEVRAQVTPHFDLLATGAVQKTTRVGSVTILLNAAQLGRSGADIYAAEYTTGSATIPGYGNSYEDTILPTTTGSLFGTYRFDWGLKLSGGITYVGETSGIAPNPVVVPDYITARAAVSYTIDRYTFDLSVENLTDKRYFYLGQDAYSEVAALPGVARSFHFRVAAQF